MSRTILSLAQLPTLRELYARSVLKKPLSTPKFPAAAGLLDRVALYQGDITKVELHSIVNAANRSLLGGGGVDGAIHRAAGKELLEECRTLNGCETGDAKITKGYDLPSKHVIHTVGPIYDEDEDEQCAEELSSCYSKSLKLAVQNGLKQIAFPSISTGIYGYPIDSATHIALRETRTFLDSDEGKEFERVVFVVFSDKDRETYEELLPLYFPEPAAEPEPDSSAPSDS
ncbi:A1pp-domain-containing protein [Stereum hirsutum FP-91666 SS1]|uniref:A1pp-domain-containing protein n=1 Tax=Stereum hirsutum (strain FP-91666) TaxID=721885 RepID=UPI000440C9BF|nr:A1pp-domain-containing protein [Stereum hirsutum FP-91666 SS1]EIM91151.1 A1pp-domain-containing protein [Stereum hirsutum FP-91666 SS1]